MAGRMSRNKGKVAERQVRDLFRNALRPVLGAQRAENIRRNHQQAETGGADLVGVPYYSVEVKWHSTLPGPTVFDVWWEQACRAAEDQDREPCLVYRANRGGWHVALWCSPFPVPRVEDYPCYVAIMRWDIFKDYLVERCSQEQKSE